MTTTYEERLAAACSAYLAAAEQVDSERARAETVAMCLRAAEQAADRARDELVQVVREGNAAAQLDARQEAGVRAVIDPVTGRDTGATIIGGRIVPSARATEARDAFFSRYGITITREPAQGMGAVGEHVGDTEFIPDDGC